MLLTEGYRLLHRSDTCGTGMIEAVTIQARSRRVSPEVLEDFATFMKRLEIFTPLFLFFCNIIICRALFSQQLKLIEIMHRPTMHV